MTCLLYCISLAAVLPAELPAALQADEAARIATIAKVKPAVVAIFGKDDAGGGSGVLISPDGFALSNYHVTSACGAAMKCGLPDGSFHDAVIVGIDPVGDVALIKLLGKDPYPFVPLGDSDALAVGDPVLAMGNPFLLATNFDPTATLGIVSGLHRYQPFSKSKDDVVLLEYCDCIQTDASINPGNSGGPLFNLAGAVVGINGRISIEKRGRVNVGVGYAIAANQIKNFLDHLHSGMVIDHATLGATVGADDAGRVVVQSILDDSEAYRRGLRVGDEIVSFAGRPIGSANQFKNILGVFPKGWRLELVYRRGQQKQSIRVKLQGVNDAKKIAKTAEAAPAKKARTPTPKAKAEPPPPEKLPESVAPYFEAKSGFANFYFQKQQRDRLLAVIKPTTQTSESLSFQLVGPSGDALTITANREQLVVKQKDQTTTLATGEPAKGAAGLADLLVALDQWRQLLADPAWFSRIEAVGGLPDQEGKVRPSLFTERNGVRATWLIDADQKQICEVECQSDVKQEGCEIRWSDFAGRLPRRWEITLAGKPTIAYRLAEKP